MSYFGALLLFFLIYSPTATIAVILTLSVILLRMLDSNKVIPNTRKRMRLSLENIVSTFYFRTRVLNSLVAVVDLDLYHGDSRQNTWNLTEFMFMKKKINSSKIVLPTHLFTSFNWKNRTSHVIW